MNHWMRRKLHAGSSAARGWQRAGLPGGTAAPTTLSAATCNEGTAAIFRNRAREVSRHRRLRGRLRPITLRLQIASGRISAGKELKRFGDTAAVIELSASRLVE
jgi:hypothetical protein